jgi:hypothetical protein
MLYFCRIFAVSLVSSDIIKLTDLRISSARSVISERFPIGVETINKVDIFFCVPQAKIRILFYHLWPNIAITRDNYVT